jgi:hypothetical protein
VKTKARAAVSAGVLACARRGRRVERGGASWSCGTRARKTRNRRNAIELIRTVIFSLSGGTLCNFHENWR